MISELGLASTRVARCICRLYSASCRPVDKSDLFLHNPLRTNRHLATAESRLVEPQSQIVLPLVNSCRLMVCAASQSLLFLLFAPVRRNARVHHGCHALYAQSVYSQE